MGPQLHIIKYIERLLFRIVYVLYRIPTNNLDTAIHTYCEKQ